MGGATTALVFVRATTLDSPALIYPLPVVRIPPLATPVWEELAAFGASLTAFPAVWKSHCAKTARRRLATSPLSLTYRPSVLTDALVTELAMVPNVTAPMDGKESIVEPQG